MAIQYAGGNNKTILRPVRPIPEQEKLPDSISDPNEIRKFQTFQGSSEGFSKRIFDRAPQTTTISLKGAGSVDIPYYSGEFKELVQTDKGFEVVTKRATPFLGRKGDVRGFSEEVISSKPVDLSNPQVIETINQGISSGRFNVKQTTSELIAQKQKSQIQKEISLYGYSSQALGQRGISVETAEKRRKSGKDIFTGKNLSEKALQQGVTSEERVTKSVDYYNPLTGKGKVAGRDIELEKTIKPDEYYVKDKTKIQRATLSNEQLISKSLSAGLSPVEAIKTLDKYKESPSQVESELNYLTAVRKRQGKQETVEPEGFFGFSPEQTPGVDWTKARESIEQRLKERESDITRLKRDSGLAEYEKLREKVNIDVKLRLYQENPTAENYAAIKPYLKTIENIKPELVAELQNQLSKGNSDVAAINEFASQENKRYDKIKELQKDIERNEKILANLQDTTEKYDISYEGSIKTRRQLIADTALKRTELLNVLGKDSGLSEQQRMEYLNPESIKAPAESELALGTKSKFFDFERNLFEQIKTGSVKEKAKAAQGYLALGSYVLFKPVREGLGFTTEKLSKSAAAYEDLFREIQFVGQRENRVQDPIIGGMITEMKKPTITQRVKGKISDAYSFVVPKPIKNVKNLDYVGIAAEVSSTSKNFLGGGARFFKEKPVEFTKLANVAVAFSAAAALGANVGLRFAVSGSSKVRATGKVLGLTGKVATGVLVGAYGADVAIGTLAQPTREAKEQFLGEKLIGETAALVTGGLATKGALSAGKKLGIYDSEYIAKVFVKRQSPKARQKALAEGLRLREINPGEFVAEQGLKGRRQYTKQFLDTPLKDIQELVSLPAKDIVPKIKRETKFREEAFDGKPLFEQDKLLGYELKGKVKDKGMYFEGERLKSVETSLIKEPVKQFSITDYDGKILKTSKAELPETKLTTLTTKKGKVFRVKSFEGGSILYEQTPKGTLLAKSYVESPIVKQFKLKKSKDFDVSILEPTTLPKVKKPEVVKGTAEGEFQAIFSKKGEKVPLSKLTKKSFRIKDDIQELPYLERQVSQIFKTKQVESGKGFSSEFGISVKKDITQTIPFARRRISAKKEPIFEPFEDVFIQTKEPPIKDPTLKGGKIALEEAVVPIIAKKQGKADSLLSARSVKGLAEEVKPGLGEGLSDVKVLTLETRRPTRVGQAEKTIFELAFRQNIEGSKVIKGKTLSSDIKNIITKFKLPSDKKGKVRLSGKSKSRKLEFETELTKDFRKVKVEPVKELKFDFKPEVGKTKFGKFKAKGNVKTKSGKLTNVIDVAKLSGAASSVRNIATQGKFLKDLSKSGLADKTKVGIDNRLKSDQFFKEITQPKVDSKTNQRVAQKTMQRTSLLQEVVPTSAVAGATYTLFRPPSFRPPKIPKRPQAPIRGMGFGLGRSGRDKESSNERSKGFGIREFKTLDLIPQNTQKLAYL